MTPPPLPPLPAPRRWPWRLTICGALVALLMTASAGVWAVRRFRPLPPRPAETARAVRDEARAAFATSAPADADAELAAFADTLSRFSSALRARDPVAGERVLDVDRLFDELLRLQPTQRPQLTKQGQFKAGFRKGVLGVFSHSSALMPWDAADIRLVKRLETPGDVVLTVRIHQPGLVLPMRFWLHEDRGWRVYDWEDLSAGLRSTTLMGQILSDPSPAFAARFTAIKEGMRELNTGRPAEAEKHLAGVDLRGLPDTLAAVAQACRGSALLQLQRPHDALPFLKEAERLNADAPMIMLLKATGLNRTGDHAGAEVAARRAIALLGPDGLSSYQLGIALNGLDRRDEAEAALREGLKADPESIDCMAELAEVLPPERQAEVGRYFDASRFTKESFRALSGHLEQQAATARALAAVVDAYRRANGATIDGDLYHAAALLLSGDAAAAAEIASGHLTTTDPYWRDAVLSRYLQPMLESGRALEGYRTAPDADMAFAYLAPRLDGKPTEPLLEELITLHTAERPSDYLGWQWKGFTAMRDRRPADADAAYVRALDHCNDEQRQAVQHYRAVAWYHLGKGEQAYREFLGGREGFAELARLYCNDENADGLAALIAAHRAAVPDDPALPFREGCVAYLRHDDANAVAAFRSFRAAEPEHDLAAANVNYLIRTLARMNDRTALEDEAKRLIEKPSTPYSELLIYASIGDTKRAAAAAARFTADSPDESLIDDPVVKAVLAPPDRAALKQALIAATQPAAAPQ